MENVKIIEKDEKQIIVFPDRAFKDFLIRNFDRDGDGEISLDEAKHIESVDLWHCVKKSTGPDDPPIGFPIEVESLAGIEYFENLRGFGCTGSKIKGSLNLVQNNHLQSVVCEENEITELILGDQPELICLYCSDNLIKKLDISRASKLA